MPAAAATVLIATALDLALREPPARLHPVVAMGRYLDLVAPPAGPPRRAVVHGSLAWAGGMVLSAGTAVALDRLLPHPVARGVVLWTLVSGRLLRDEVAAVERALAGGVAPGRAQLSRIVSRDTASLSEAEVRASALESLAENLSDSVVAPLLWYAVGGLPAAAAYRFANTADAMWGYRDDRWRHAGRVAARADDLLNLAPARLTAIALLALGRAPRPSWHRLRAEARRTASPNSGWPMAALALTLDVRLPKPGHYVLNPAGREPVQADTRRALGIATATAVVAVALTALGARRGAGR